MENQPNQAPKNGNKTLWVVLLIVILVIAGYGVYALVLKNTNTSNTNNANATSNTNSAVNTNSNANVATNTNSAVNGNANTVANLNTNTATNTNIDTSGWKTYNDNEFGFSFKYPDNIQLKILSDTGEIAYRASQEYVPLFKALNGTQQDAVDWLNTHFGENKTFANTDRVLTIDGTQAPVYSNYQYNNYAIAAFGNYTIISHIVDNLFDDPQIFWNIVYSVKK